MSDIRFGASPLLPGAVIVDVPLLLDLTDESATAMATANKAAEREIVFHDPMPVGESTIHDVLYSVPKFMRHQRRMHTGVCFTVPVKIARVKTISQNDVNGGSIN